MFYILFCGMGMYVDFQDLKHMNIDLRGYSFQAGRQAFSYPHDAYNDWVLLACVEGEFRFRMDHQSGEVRSGEMVLCPPEATLHREVISALTFLFVRFDLSLQAAEGLKEFPFSGKMAFRNRRRALSSLESMQKLGVRTPVHYKEHLIRDILLQYLQEQSSPLSGNGSDDPSIQEAIRYLRQHCHEEISLQQLAAQIGFSPSQFTRKFQQEMAVTPIKYLNQVRLE
ncbi:MAG: transcriptional regulator, AraC family, partial [Paenibacillaceae bacterium]|nr:transcriptional regulator, AraC family [Paenibacillaceae bacterium]